MSSTANYGFINLIQRHVRVRTTMTLSPAPFPHPQSLTVGHGSSQIKDTEVNDCCSRVENSVLYLI